MARPFWGVLVVALPQVAGGRLTGADLALIGLCVLAASDAVCPLLAAYGVLGETLAAARRMFEIADAPSASASREPPCRRRGAYTNPRGG